MENIWRPIAGRQRLARPATGVFQIDFLGSQPDSPSVSGAISRVVEGVKLYRYRGNTKSYIQ